MPDVTLVVRGLSDMGEVEKLERALTRLNFVRLVNVDREKSLVAISYEGDGSKLDEIEATIKKAGYETETSPGAERVTE